ncbi:conserved hypothetical protein [Methanohalobium evestigatum Z-7303]|uniref:DUF7490 domain-containing protein n=1 Tax=Methanohalobium evestigatum (strain ATCC BAA-1072 / DSM 3721 / NBRC 107634 / OCM 161 / Z-7303) TaxID=644295 RepID=D7EBB6_METEZ|nr:hypothetical protein [Methanohalobium evestigatum]ADI74633.1 conserved hypothetical protein [Methanohalobium evestigatum Z-7303]
MGGTLNSYRITAAIAAVVFFIAFSGCVEETAEPSRLRVTNMDISADEVQISYVDINVTTYIENHGANSDNNTSLLLKAYNENTGLLETEKLNDIGVVESGKTHRVIQSMELPKKGDYRITATIFENNKQESTGQIKIHNLENLKADVLKTGIEIGEIDFIVKRVEDGRALIQNDIYLTNEGRSKSSNYRILVKARQIDSGLIADKEWASTAFIQPENTVIKSIDLEIPDNYNYRVEILLWSNNTIVNRGVDYLQLEPEKEIDEDTRTETKDIETSDFVSDTRPRPESSGEEAAPGFKILPAIGAIFAMVLILKRKLN